MKYLSLFYEFKIAICQESTRHTPPQDQWAGSRVEGGGEWLGVGKEIWRALICAHLKFEIHPQGPCLLLWCCAISEFDQSYLTYNPRSNVNKQLLSFPPHPIWIPLEKVAVGKQGVDHLTFRKRKQVPPFIGFRQNLFLLKKKHLNLNARECPLIVINKTQN